MLIGSYIPKFGDDDFPEMLVNANKRCEITEKGEDGLKIRHEKEGEVVWVGLLRLRLWLNLPHIANSAVKFWASYADSCL